MKTFFIAVVVLLTVNLSSNELAWVDEQVEAIKPPRTGMKGRELAAVKDPFIFLKKNRIASKDKKSSAKKSSTQQSLATKKVADSSTIKKKKSLSVTMLMNSSAMINGNWYKVGDTVNGYKVSKMDTHSVLLTKKSKKLLLSTNSKSKNLNLNNK